MKNNNLDFKNINDFSLDYPSVKQLSKDQLLNINILKKFNFETIVTIINNYYTEEDKIALLRSDDFIEYIPDYTLEMILNNMFFNSVFNMLQNKRIFNKIKSIDANIRAKDYFLIPGYLDSINLVNKSNHLMIYNLLSVLNKEQIKKYLNQTYMYQKLNIQELIYLASSKNINILDILIIKKINDYDLEDYINKMWHNKLDYNLVDKDYVKKHLLNLNTEARSKIDFKDITYLMDYINTHSIITIQESPITLDTLRSVIACYEILGIKGTLAIIQEGNKKITLNDIKNLGEYLINYQLYQFKINNANMFDNITGKVVNELNTINQYQNLSNLINHSPYLRNIISLSNIYNYGDATTFFSDYLKYEPTFHNEAKIKLYKFLNGLINHIYLDQKKYRQHNFNEEILKHYSLKLPALFNKKRKSCKGFIENLKVKVLLNTFNSQDKEKYQYFYKDKYNVNDISESFKKGLNKYNIDISEVINSILIPLCKDKFSYEKTLKNLNIKLPDQFNLIIEENKEQKLIYRVNKELKKLMRDLSDEDKIDVLNYICYQTPLKSNENIKTWQSIHDKIQYLNGNIFIDKDLTIGYQNNLLLENIDEYHNIKKMMLMIDDIIKYTYYFVNKTIKTEVIAEQYQKEINDYLRNKTFTFKMNSHNYETSKNGFCFTNIENAFRGFDLSKSIEIDDNFKDAFIKNNYLKYAALGYFQNYFPNFGQIISDYESLNADKKTTDFFQIYDDIQKKKRANNPLYDYLSKNTKRDLALNISDSLKLYEEIQSKNYATIPQIKGCINNINYETVDFHDDALLTTEYPEIIRNIQLHNYLCTNENGYYISFKDVISNKGIGNLCLTRNGNVVYLNKLNINAKDINIDELLKKIANSLIELTKSSKEQINFVIFNTYDDYALTNSIKVNSQIVENLINPLLDDAIIHNYNDANCLLIASNEELKKDNIKAYQPKSKYYRNRNNYKIISSLAPDNEITEINKILYLNTPNKNLFIPLNINDYKEIIYGDDWFIAKKNNNEIESVSIGSDIRSCDEMAYFLFKSQKKTKTMKVA